MTRIVQRASMNRRRRLFALSVVFVCSLFAWNLPTIASAEMHVEGNLTAVRVSTSRNTISDVLSALAATFNVPYRTAIPLNTAADATYSGSFRQVISRLLDGYDYVVKMDSSKVTEVVVFGKRGEVGTPPKAPTDKPEVASVQSNADESNAMGLCMSMGDVKLSRE